jgi:hypothetical protein
MTRAGASIVLAIAGLILMIVFLAVPTLERNSRNDLRKQDIALMLQAVSHYELVDSGNFPSPCGPSPTYVHYCDYTVSNSNNEFLRYDASGLRYYVPADITLINQTSSAPAASVPAETNADKVKIYNYEQCNPSTNGGTDVGAGYNTVIALYALEESGSSVTSQCQTLAS